MTSTTHLDYFRLQAEEAQLVAKEYLDKAGVTQEQLETLRANRTFSGVGVVGEKGSGPSVMYLEELTIDDALVWAACNLWGICRTIKAMIDDPYHLNGKLREQHLTIEWELKDNPKDQSLKYEWLLIEQWREMARMPPPQAGMGLQKFLQWVKQPEVAQFHYREMQIKAGKKGGKSPRGYSDDLDRIIRYFVNKVGSTRTDIIWSQIKNANDECEDLCNSIGDITEDGDQLEIKYLTKNDVTKYGKFSLSALDKRLRKIRSEK